MKYGLLKFFLTILMKTVLWLPLRFLPQDANLFLFTSGIRDSYAGNTRYLFKRMSQEDGAKCYWVTENISIYKYILHKNYKAILYPPKRLSDLLIILRAKYLFGTHNNVLPIFLLSTKKTAFQTWHGIPIKNMGLKRKDMTNTEKRIAQYMLNQADYFLSPSKMYSDAMSLCFGIPKEKFIQTGYPRNDILSLSCNKRQILRDVGIPEEYLASKVLLYAPTFRKDQNTTLFPFSDFSIREFDELLARRRMVCIVRRHYYEVMSEMDRKEISKRIFFFPSSMFETELQEVLNVTDILVTDYSGIYFDFLIKNRPIIFIPYDFETYNSTWGFLYDYFENTPGPKAETFLDFKNIVERYDDDPDMDHSQRNLILKKFIEKRDNKSTERLIEFVNQLNCRQQL